MGSMKRQMYDEKATIVEHLDVPRVSRQTGHVWFPSHLAIASRQEQPADVLGS